MLYLKLRVAQMILIKKRLAIFNVFVFTLLITLLILAGFFDLDISKALFNLIESGKILSNIGDLPIGLGVTFCSAILFSYFPFKKGRVLLLKIISAAGVLGGCIILWVKFQTYIGLEDILFKYFTPIAFSIISALIIMFLTKYLSASFVKKMLIFAIYTLILILAVRFCAGIIKLLWQRLRFLNLDQVTFRGFTPWWQPQFTTKGREHLVVGTYYNDKTFMSFVSGTTAAAGNLFAVILLPDVFKNLRKYRLAFHVMPLLYCLFVGISRVIAGAHYLSDIVASIILTYSFALIIRKICLSDKFKKFANYCINLFYDNPIEHLPLSEYKKTH